jgi:hypothetical protein
VGTSLPPPHSAPAIVPGISHAFRRLRISTLSRLQERRPKRKKPTLVVGNARGTLRLPRSCHSISAQRCDLPIVRIASLPSQHDCRRQTRVFSLTRTTRALVRYQALTPRARAHAFARSHRSDNRSCGPSRASFRSHPSRFLFVVSLFFVSLLFLRVSFGFFFVSSGFQDKGDERVGEHDKELTAQQEQDIDEVLAHRDWSTSDAEEYVPFVRCDPSFHTTTPHCLARTHSCSLTCAPPPSTHTHARARTHTHTHTHTLRSHAYSPSASV